MPNRWISQLLLLGAWLALALLLGAWFGRPAWWLAGALALYLAATLRNVYVLDRILRRGKHIPLQTRGLWAELFAEIDKLKTKARRRKKRYHQLVREVRASTGALHDAGIILNAASEIQWFNPAATRLVGLDPRTDVGQRIDNLLRHPDLVSHLDDPQKDVIIIPSPKDDAGQLAVQIIPYGKAQRLAIIRDVTREVQLERTRRDFVANASHELRSPLTVIGGYLDALAEDEDLSASWQAPISEMERQAERMTRILRDLIELTRLESAGREAPYEFVDVVKMLQLIHRELAAMTGAPRIGMHLDTDDALLGSEPELYSVFHNLVHNAVRFTPGEGEVKCHWRHTDSGVVFSVTDSGIGIPEEMIPRITERFFRVDPGRSRELGGTGLGLAIVKHALQRHQATLHIESRVGEGSTFRCGFPTARIATRGGAVRAVI